MAVSHRYKDFGNSKKRQADETESADEAMEDLKLQSFEAGYQAGWDDALKAQSDEQTKISTELGQNLQEMSFTYHEVLAKLTGSMQPVIEQMIDKLLPEIVKNALGAHIIEQLMALIGDQTAQSVEIVVAPQNVEKINALVEESLKEPFKIVAEASLGEGQAFIRVGQNERLVDLDTVVTGVTDAFLAFFHENERGD